MSRYSDLEITFTKRAAHSYSLGFRFKGAGDAAEQRATTEPLVALPSFALAGDDPQAYAKALTDAFFTPEVRAEFNRFRAAALSHSALRVRLSIDAQEPELHAVRWETLRDPDPPPGTESEHLFTGERILVSRFPSSGDWRQIELSAKGALRALAVVASPGSSARFNLDPIDVPAEIQLATSSMNGISVTPLAPGGAVSLNTLAAKLREGFDILYLVCHGKVAEDLPWLFLNDGQPTSGHDLVQAIRELEHRPRMIVLASCQSAGKDSVGLAALGPLLAEAGVPAVIAMQGDISMSTASAFMHHFFTELLVDGQIDRAMAVARGEVRKADDYWMPVLFMRLREGRIWREPEPPANQPIVHLPQRKALLVPRDEEIKALHQQLREEGSLTYIPGIPGLGKTTLALEYAHRHQHDFDSVHWLSCQQSDLAKIAGDLARQLGLKLDGDLDTIIPELNAHCARKHLLLVFDNVEDETPARLFPDGRSSVLITTRRTSLRFLRQHQHLDLRLFTPGECLELFRKEIGPSEVDKHEAEAHRLFERLGYLPIGISVAASLIREDLRYTIKSMAENLPADTHALLREAVAALSPPSQTLIAAMAVCAPEGFRLSLAAEIVGVDESTSLGTLHEIHSRSLVEELDRDTRRYRLHALVRDAAEATDALRGKHAEGMKNEFEIWETDWRNCEADMADFQTAFAWLLGQSDKNAWSTVNSLAYSSFELTKRLGRLPEAFDICERMIREASRREGRERLSGWQGNDALILKRWGRLDEALALLQKQEAICLDLGDQNGLQASYGNQALILKDWGRLDEAMALLQKQEAICIELGNRDGLSGSYGNQALILQAWGRLNEALALHKKQEAICIELGNRDGLSSSYGNQALILKAWGRLDEALALHKKEEAICIELGDRDGLQASYGNQAIILKAWGRPDEALALLQKQEAICLDLGNRNNLQISYGNQALILKAWGRLDEALALLQKQEAICLELGNKSSLAYCYANWGLLVRRLGDRDAELDKLKRSLALFSELKMPSEIKFVQDELDETLGNA